MLSVNKIENVFICPKCQSNINYNITENLRNVILTCSCTFSKKMRTKEFLKQLKIMSKKQKETNEMKDKINSAQNHIKGYFTKVRDNLITSLISQINKINYAFQDSYETNTTILSILKRLIDLNKEVNPLYNFNIYECENLNDTKTILNYYTEYHVISLDIASKSLHNINTLTNHTDIVNSLILLSDGRIASSSKDTTIKIFNPYKKYSCDLTLEGHKDYVISLCKLDNNDIASASWDHSIKIWSITRNSYKCLYTIDNAHKGNIMKILSLPNNRIATISTGKLIKI